MKTNVRIPQFLNKFLNMYAVVTVGVGFIVIVLVNSPYIKSLTVDVEAYTSGAGDIINVCGGVPFQIEPSIWSDPVREQCRYGAYTCNDAGCNAMTEECYINIFRCEEGEEASNGYECLVNPDEDSQGERIFYETATYSMLFNNNPDPYHPSELPTDCLMLQIDLVCNGNSTDFVVWRGGRFGSPECEAPPPRPACGDGVVDPGEECDPPGDTSQCNYGVCQSDCTCLEAPPEGECGDGIIDPGEDCDPPGSTDQCSYGACQSDCTCPSPPQSNKDFTIDKVVNNGYVYDIGDTITFEVNIVNTGNVVFDHIYFEDEYNPLYLQFSDISGIRERGGVTIESSNLRSYIEPLNPNGEYSIGDLTTYLGNLGVNERFELTILFIARAVPPVNPTCNIAIADDGEGIYREDDECISINPLPTPPIPPTDR